MEISMLRQNCRAASARLALIRACAAILAGSLGAPAATAQWLHYPTAGVPRTATGEPNLAAPAPRTASGLPDLSGIWVAAGEALPQCDEGEECITQMPLPLDAVDIGRTSGGPLPYQPWAAALVKQRTADFAKDDPHARCLPPSFPRAYALPQYKKIVQTPSLTLLLHEFNATYRQIFTDGRPLPVDPEPGWQGYSVGRWEGDTLVVETNGFRDDLWLDLIGSPLTSAARVVERFRRPSFGQLEIVVAVDDPKAYTKPWTVTLVQSIVLDTELLDQICLENERSVELMVEPAPGTRRGEGRP
jgi:hypothetical protein